ncbi:MAG: hypothetical protein ACR2KG_11590 [Nocardioidaceae bacterium]
MTNRPPDSGPLDPVHRATGNGRVPGGCDDCDAYQTLTKQHGIFHITTHHDDTCPWLAARESRHQQETDT